MANNDIDITKLRVPISLVVAVVVPSVVNLVALTVQATLLWSQVNFNTVSIEKIFANLTARDAYLQRFFIMEDRVSQVWVRLDKFEAKMDEIYSVLTPDKKQP